MQNMIFRLECQELSALELGKNLHNSLSYTLPLSVNLSQIILGSQRLWKRRLAGK